MAARVMVLPSPLLPPLAYAGLRDDLRDSGTDVRIAGPELSAGQCAADLVRRWAQQCGPDTVIVAHSNAGYLAPLVRATSTADNPIVFMDAALPPVKGDSALAPPSFRDRPQSVHTPAAPLAARPEGCTSASAGPSVSG